MSENGELVQLYVYDLSRGLASQLSPMLLGKQVRKEGRMYSLRMESSGKLAEAACAD